MLDLGGTYRAVSAEETLLKVEPMLWDKFGITRVGNVTGLDNINIPTYIAIRPQSTFLTTSQGKGINHALAKVSAIMEAIEGWHSEFIPEPDLFGSYNDLSPRYNLLNLDSNASNGVFNWNKIDSLEIPWVKGMELNHGREAYIPYTLVNMNTVSYRPGFGQIPPSTNGLASGNTLEEAICHALFEVIERECESDFEDTISTHNFRLDLSSVDAPHIKELLKHLEQRDLYLDVHDITNHLQIPTFYAYLDDRNDLRSVGKQCGSGCHLSSVVALSRAITEAVQARATVISGSRDDIFPAMYKKNKTVQYKNTVSGFSDEQKMFVDTPVHGDFSTCLEQLLRRLKQHGYDQVVVYNHTREYLNIPVVHVVVPGFRFNVLRHLNNG